MLHSRHDISEGEYPEIQQDHSDNHVTINEDHAGQM